MTKLMLDTFHVHEVQLAPLKTEPGAIIGNINCRGKTPVEDRARVPSEGAAH